MGWFGKLHMHGSRRAAPRREMQEISSWYTTNLLGNVLFAGKQYLAAGRSAARLRPGRGPKTPLIFAWSLHGRQSPSSARPSVLCKVESGENLSEFPTLRGLPVWLGEIWVSFKQSEIKPGPPGWSWASYPVTHSTEQAPELPPLGCFANLAF